MQTNFDEFFQQLQNKKIIKTIPAYKPIPSGNLSSPEASPEKKVEINPVSPTSPDRRSGSSKKSRRPNSAASDLSDGHKAEKVPNNEPPLPEPIQQQQSPTSANTSTSSSATSSKQSSTSSLTDATSSSSPEPAGPPVAPPKVAHPLPPEEKQAPVIVKLAKADGVYYNKKDSEKKHYRKDDTQANFSSSASASEDTKNLVHCEFC